MGVRNRFLAGLAAQLGRPDGLRGRLVARLLNRANRANVTAAVDATSLAPGHTAADIGFGGGVGLPLLLARVGPDGHVHGIDPSPTVLARGARAFRDQTRSGLLTLQAGSITALPLPDSCLDAAITVNTVYFVADLDLAFAELARTLRPGGRAVVGIGDPDAMAASPVTATGFTIRPLDDVVAALVRAGLAQVERRRIGEGHGAMHLLVARREHG
jgi:SAM-dependent methyltransferase